jgi:DNA-binding NarL/FixJ family response regulator
VTAGPRGADGVPARRVLVVDDQPAFRSVLRSVLESEPSYTVVGEAADGTEAVSLALALRPDVVVMDLRLPGVDGAEATRRILAADPTQAVVLVSTVRRADLPARLLDCGALGFLPKEEVGVRAIEALLEPGRRAGGSPWSTQ